MSEYWKTQDLDGDGLQTINQYYSRLKRESKTAYFLCTLFPIGAHQFYLKAHKKGYAYLALTIVSLIALTFSNIVALIIFLIEIVILTIDTIQLEDKVNRYNKNLKMNLSLQTNNAPAKDYRGRYTDDSPVEDYEKIKSNEITAFETKKNNDNKSKIYSFAEQERMLREMNENKKNQNRNRPDKGQLENKE